MAISKIIGCAAATLTMFAFVPQVYKMYRYKSAKDVSLLTLIQLAAGVVLWIVYGIFRKDPIIILANTVTLVTLLTALGLYSRYGRAVTKGEKGNGTAPTAV
jgi:MtN3 and saliva related transmembrane protein